MNKFESYPIVNKFRQETGQLTEPPGKLIVGVSGGPDSMALLYIMHRLDLNAFVVHCNYQLRGKSSDQDQELVESACSLWELECVSVRLEPDSKGNENFQLWARNERYSIFRDLLREQNADFIVTAHHQDDQLETILQKILRGSGISAWKGMRVLDDDLFRPLLKTTKSEIMQFVQEMNVPYRIDSSNEESTYARNFLRHQWFPSLQKLFPGWRDNILKLENRAREYDLMADEILNRVSESPNSLKKDEFLKLPVELQKSMLYRLLNNHLEVENISVGMLENISGLKELQTGKSIQLSDDLMIISDRKHFTLKPYSGKPLRKVLERTDIKKGVEISHMAIIEEEYNHKFNDNELKFDAEVPEYPLIIKKWNEGDEFQPLGMTGKQKISDHLTHRKIKPSLKKDAIVIESFDGIICAVIFPHIVNKNQIGTLSEKVKCTSETTRTVTIQKI